MNLGFPVVRMLVAPIDFQTLQRLIEEGASTFDISVGKPDAGCDKGRGVSFQQAERAAIDNGREAKLTHFGGLDALRGLAAFSVVAHHAAYFYLDAANPAGMLRYALILLRQIGHPAVVIFFALSGFVLQMSFLRNGSMRYGLFLTRRFFRIYPAFYVVILAAAAVYLVVSIAGDGHGDYWLYVRPAPTTVADYGMCLTLLLPAASLSLLPVAWSMVHEMRFSLLFPFVAPICRKNPGIMIAVSVLCYLAGMKILHLMGAYGQHIIGRDLAESVATTFFYLPVFVIGMCCSTWVGQGWRPKIGIWGEAAIIVISLVVFEIGKDDGISGLCAAAIIIVVVADARLARFLSTSLMQFLGRISYSLYLVHFPILFYATHLMVRQSHLVLGGALIAAMLAAIAAATLLQKWVEAPFQRVGKWLSASHLSDKSRLGSL